MLSAGLWADRSYDLHTSRLKLLKSWLENLFFHIRILQETDEFAREINNFLYDYGPINWNELDSLEIFIDKLDQNYTDRLIKQHDVNSAVFIAHDNMLMAFNKRMIPPTIDRPLATIENEEDDEAFAWITENKAQPQREPSPQAEHMEDLSPPATRRENYIPAAVIGGVIGFFSSNIYIVTTKATIIAGISPGLFIGISTLTGIGLFLMVAYLLNCCEEIEENALYASSRTRFD